MSDSHFEILNEIKQTLLNGDSQTAINRINSFIDSKSLSKQTKLEYQLLQAKALTHLDNYFHSTSVLDSIEENILQAGNNLQKLDFYICKIENLLISGKTNLGMNLNDEAEKILEQIHDPKSNPIMHRKVDLLILKYRLISNVYGYIDKLQELLELCFQFCLETNYDYGKALILERMFDYYSELGENDKAGKCVHEAHEIWNKLGHKKGIAYTTFLKGVNMVTSDSDDTLNASLNTLNEALELNQKLEAKLTESKIHNSIGCLLLLKDKREEGLEHLETSINIKREIGDKPGLISILYNIGQLYITEMKGDKALSYLHEGLSLSKEIDYQRPYYLIQYALNTLYMKRGELNRALRFLEEAVNFFEEKNLLQEVAWSRERLADILVLKGDLSNALQNYIQSQEYYEKENKLVQVCIILNNIAEIHQLKGDYNLALKYYKKGENLASKIEYNFIKAEIAYNLFSLYLDKNQFEEVEKNLEKLKEISKRAKTEKTTIMVKLAEVLLIVENKETEKREEAKKLLKAIIDEKNIEQKFISTAILNLCELLLTELRETEIWRY